MSYNVENDRGHNAPCSNRDFDFFYRGLVDQRLLVQKCSDCGTLRSLPSPCCPHCRSFDWQEYPLSGKGVIHSYVIHYHPPLPGFTSPHPVVLADMEEGVRILAAMDGTPPESVTIGTAVTTEFVRRGDVAGLRFRLV
ncbi:nucleic acid-binding protein [Niveispirillum sp. SYP-B3756]|uniref:Zn-ribbon domain-containing OB-fold protein n=1 Tax=Niveispirillum sp. SYP-B3756 TaxID=2662178 RepID=UPI001290C3D4|nr:OB-fold domain-containing protein [Niveispirillum sp. SYP-B3756]MQP68327.1 nucleic acid-binding protein [Niveispirillum sp. SYP-B3756]